MLLSTAQFAVDFFVEGCYSRHSLRVSRCYRQHIWRVVIYDTVWIFRARVVIFDTGQNRCYLRHISDFQPKITVVIGGTVRFRVVILGTICRGCYRQHIFPENLQVTAHCLSIHRCIFSQELLFTAQFRVLLNTAQFGDFSVVIRSTFCFWVVILGTIQNLLLFTAHFGKRPVVIPDTVSAWVVILGTVVVGCKRGHNLWWLCAEFQRLLFTAQFGFLVCGLLCCAQISPCVVSLGIVYPVVRHDTLFCRAQLCG